jgi:hypothetical protein
MVFIDLLETFGFGGEQEDVAAQITLAGNPAFNQDRGPVSVFAAQLHWEF